MAQGLDDVFDRLDFGPALERALAALHPEFAEAVILVDIEDYTYADVATSLGIPVGTVRSRLFRGRRLLQEALIEYARDFGLGASRTASTGEDTTDTDRKGI